MDWKDWVPDEAIAELTVRRALENIEDPVKMANDLFKEALPLATMGMVHLAVHESNPQIRFNAQKYVIDRNMGSVQSPVRAESEAPAWQRIFDSIATVAQDD